MSEVIAQIVDVADIVVGVVTSEARFGNVNAHVLCTVGFDSDLWWTLYPTYCSEWMGGPTSSGQWYLR